MHTQLTVIASETQNFFLGYVQLKLKYTKVTLFFNQEKIN